MPKAKAESKGLDINPYTASLSPTELTKLRRSLAKRANQRLVRLERARSKISGERYSDIGAAPIAKEYLSYKKRNRFLESRKPMSYEEERREVSVLQSFLKSKSSLVSGIRDIERRRIEKFESGQYGSYDVTGKKRRGLKFSSTKEFYDFLNSGLFKDLQNAGFSSEQILEEYDTARETFKGSVDEAFDAMEEALDKFRLQGSVTLKDLRAAARGKPLK